MSDVEDTVRSLLEENEPDLEEVRTVRRRIAADPENEGLAQQLMKIEKGIEREGTPPEETVENLLGELRESRRLHLTMADVEPFPEARLDILKRALETTGGQVIDEDETTVLVQVPDEASTQYVQSLYHWSVVNDDA